MHGLLKKHPQVFLAHPKEIHFFSLYYSKGVDWYANKFLGSDSFAIRGEVTPYYLFHPLSSSRIYKILPSTKLIILLRDPVERAFSQYFHSRRLGLEPLGIQDAFQAENRRLMGSRAVLESGKTHYSHQHHSYLSRSRYEIQLSSYENLFAAEQLLVLPSELLFHDVHSAWHLILNFLELESCSLPQDVSKYHGSTLSDAVSPELKQFVRSQLEPTYKAIITSYGQSFRDIWL